MKLPEVLALRPGADATSDTITAAIAAATRQRVELLQRADDADRTRADGLLSADDKAIQAAEKAAGDARRAAERVAALLPTMRADLTAAQGREMLAELHIQRRAYDRLRAEMVRWQDGQYQQIAEMIGAGLMIENRLMTAWLALQANIDQAYQHQGVRDTGARFDDVTPPAGHRPSALFPTWGLPTHG